VNRLLSGRAVLSRIERISADVSAGFFCRISAATAATCGADADVPKKFGSSSPGRSSPLMNVVNGLLRPSPSSSS
jgi:hypothetical protein